TGVQTCALPISGGGDELVLGFIDVRAHLAQAAKVLLDPPRADVVASRSWHPRLSETCEQCPEQDDGGAHPAPELVGDVASYRRAGVQHYAAFPLGLPTELAH